MTTADKEKRVALITGATSGIGRLCAETLDGHGWRVASLGRTARRCEGQQEPSSQTIYLEADVRDSVATDRAIKTVIETFGQLDLVVVNAGVLEVASLRSATDEHWCRLLDTNLTGAFNTIRATLPFVTKARGRYILMSSFAAERGLPNLGAYSAAKAGLRALGDTLAAETESSGVSVHTLTMGPVDTPMLDIPGASDYRLSPVRIADLVLWLTDLPADVICKELRLRNRVAPG